MMPASNPATCERSFPGPRELISNLMDLEGRPDRRETDAYNIAGKGISAKKPL